MRTVAGGVKGASATFYCSAQPHHCWVHQEAAKTKTMAGRMQRAAMEESILLPAAVPGLGSLLAITPEETSFLVHPANKRLGQWQGEGFPR